MKVISLGYEFVARRKLINPATEGNRLSSIRFAGIGLTLSRKDGKTEYIKINDGKQLWINTAIDGSGVDLRTDDSTWQQQFKINSKSGLYNGVHIRWVNNDSKVIATDGELNINCLEPGAVLIANPGAHVKVHNSLDEVKINCHGDGKISFLNETATKNPNADILRQFTRVAALMNLPEDLRQKLLKPTVELSFKIPVRMDNGKEKNFKGFMILYKNGLGPCKGGIRFHPDVTLDNIKPLAFEMTLKCALLGVPFSGGKSGVACNPDELSAGELERLARGFENQIHKFLGPDDTGKYRYIPAPDMGTNETVMAWIMDEYAKANGGVHDPAIITGKPINMGGLPERGPATGRGAFFVLKEACKDLRIKLSEATAAVQGFGNVGAQIARELYNASVKVVAISDKWGWLYSENGIDIPELSKFYGQNKRLRGFPGAKSMPDSTKDKMLELDTTILVPAAMEHVVTDLNADKLRTKIILEAANHPLTVEADDILAQSKNSVASLSDILSNSGGVTTSYFEWVQNLEKDNKYWAKSGGVDKNLESYMKKAYRNVKVLSKRKNISIRDAAWMIAIERILKASSDPR